MAEDNEIHLGMDDMGCCNPIGAPMQESKIRYPVVHYEGPAEIELPEEGTAKVHFHVIRTVEERKAGKDWYQCDIELHWLSDVKKAEGVKEVGGTMFKSSAKETEDALDKLAKEKMAEEDEDDDEEED